MAASVLPPSAGGVVEAGGELDEEQPPKSRPPVANVATRLRGRDRAGMARRRASFME
jgi:hypothetical protein